MCRRIAIALALIALTSVGAMAADTPGDNRIARLSLIEGHVSFQHAGEIDWNAASVNMALQPADRIYTGQDGRAEIQFDDGSVFRLAEQTDAEILSLKEDLTQIRILVGLVSLTAHSSVPFEISTPAAVFTTRQEGAYRFDVMEDGDSDGIVRKGLLIAANDKFNRQVESGEVIHVTPGEQSTNEVSAYNQRDAWDEWCDRRDADMLAYQSRKYLPDDVYIGVSDLDRYGHWVDVEAYGPAWVPYYVDASWSPYYDGRWVYRPFWGWTWVSYEPWGWLPYHYGRWHFAASFGWCWFPGPSFGFHFWSPGLVRFHRGPGWVTWCPLGLGDYYNVNNYFFRSNYRYQLTNMRLLQRRGPDDLVNWHSPRSVRGLPMEDFINGGPRGRGQIAGENPGLFRGGRGEIVTGALDVRPTARSFAPSPDRTPVRPVRETERPTFVRTEPSGDAQRNGRFVRVPESSMPTGARERAPEMNRRGSETTPAGRSFSTALPGRRTEVAPANDLRQGGRNVENSTPTTSNRLPAATTGPRRESQGRVYQAPPNRQPSGAAPARNTEDMRGQRPGTESRTIQQSPPRTYQPPQAPARKNEQVNPRTRSQPNAAQPKRPEYTTNWSRSSSRDTEVRNSWARSAPSPSTGGYRGSSVASATPSRSFYSSPSVRRSESPPSSGFRSAERSSARSWGTAPGVGMRMSSPQTMRAPSRSFSAGTPRSGSAPRSGGFSRGASPQGRSRR